MIITQKQDGVPPQQTVKSTDNQLDTGNTQFYLSNNYERFEHGKSTKQPKASDDKIVLGYTEEGLPFQIVVDGFFGGETGKTFSFIDNHVVRLVDAYSAKLKQASDPSEITRSFIKEIFNLRKKYAPGCDFTMSIAVSYEKDGRLLCSGFGIGDTGIVIKRTSGETEQLVHNTKVTDIHDFKDAFESYSEEVYGIDHVIDRNDIFTTTVSRGDEIVGYTYVHDELETCVETSTESYTYNDKDKNLTIKKYGLNLDEALTPSLYDFVVEQNLLHHERKVDSVDKAAPFVQFGDDISIGKMIIPNESLQQAIKSEQKVNSLLSFALSHPILTSLSIGLMVAIGVACIVASGGIAAGVALTGVVAGAAIAGVGSGLLASTGSFFACHSRTQDSSLPDDLTLSAWPKV